MKGAALLDVNVLVALFDPAHPHHEAAHGWFGEHRAKGWATCAVTEMGCARVLANPRYPTLRVTVEQAVNHLRILCSARDHVFWAGDVSLTDEAVLDAGLIAGHIAITDSYLLALAVRNKGRLVTFDRALAGNGAAAGGGLGHVVMLG